MPRQYEKFSFQVQTDANPVAKSKIGYLPILSPRTPVVVESRNNGTEIQRVDHANSEANAPQVLEIHADVLDITFNENAKPGARPPWKPDCFCPRCGFMREQWVEENRKPFRPFSRQKESTLLAMTLARERTKLEATNEEKSMEKELAIVQSTSSSNLSDSQLRAL